MTVLFGSLFCFPLSPCLLLSFSILPSVFSLSKVLVGHLPPLSCTALPSPTEARLKFSFSVDHPPPLPPSPLSPPACHTCSSQPHLGLQGCCPSHRTFSGSPARAYLHKVVRSGLAQVPQAGRAEGAGQPNTAGLGECSLPHLPVFFSSGAQHPCEWVWAGRSLWRPRIACPLILSFSFPTMNLLAGKGTKDWPFSAAVLMS